MAETEIVALSSTQLSSSISIGTLAHQTINNNDTTVGKRTDIPPQLGTVPGPRIMATIQDISEIDHDNDKTLTRSHEAQSREANCAKKTSNVEEGPNRQENGYAKTGVDSDDHPTGNSTKAKGGGGLGCDGCTQCKVENGELAILKGELAKIKTQMRTFMAGRRHARKRRAGDFSGSESDGSICDDDYEETALSDFEERAIRRSSRKQADRRTGDKPSEIAKGDSHTIAMIVPKINWVDWNTFKRVKNNGTSNFAIDVLIGPPRHQPFGEQLSLKTGVDKGTATEADIPGRLSGQAPLPNRIRIRSPLILKAFFRIMKHDLGIGEERSLYAGDKPLVMVRPFRSLDYHDASLRNYLQHLEGRITESPYTDRCGGGEVEFDNRASSRLFEEPKETREYCGSGKPALTTTPIQELAYHLGCLVDFIDAEIKPKRTYNASRACQQVRFDDLWYLYRPGDEVVDQELRQAYRVIRVFTSDRPCNPDSPWPLRARYVPGHSGDVEDVEAARVLCIYIGFDGKVMGPVQREFLIDPFLGLRNVRSLEIYPIRFAMDTHCGNQDMASFRNNLIRRGKMFLDVAGVNHLHYSGLTLCARDEVDSEVVVDFEGAFSSTNGAHWKPDIKSLTGIEHDRRPGDLTTCPDECCRDDHSIHRDGYLEKKRTDDYLATLVPKDSSQAAPITMDPRRINDRKFDLKLSLTDEDYLIMPYRVFGFVLRSRKWAELDPNCLGPIRSIGKVLGRGQDDDGTKPQQPQDTQSGQAFHQLVLPKGHKDMILSLIAQHYRDKESAEGDSEQVDIIRGKGKGLIFLLHGAPGVGKTSTAEGVAELFQKPLFQITCGDLGTTASEVESNLSTHFALASKWGCILLLDEADVFLAARTPQDFKRNGMVSVFLRILEYYSGILFLTTNRLGDLDEAFGSRIHIGLHYPQLDQDSTRAVFELNLKLINDRFAIKGRELAIDSSGILEFANKYWIDHPDMRWNGRQIRNACQTALALAEFTAQGGSHLQVLDAGAKISLGLDQLEVVAKAYLEFTTYLDDIFDTNSERRAKQMRIRARELEKHNGHSKGIKAPVATRSVNSQPQIATGIDEATKRITGQPPIQASPSAPTTAPVGHYPPSQYSQPPVPGFPGQQMPNYPGINTSQPGYGQQPQIGNAPPQYAYPANYGQAPQNFQYLSPDNAAGGTGYAQQQPQAHQVWNTQPPQGWPAPGIPQGQSPYPQASTQQTYGILPHGLPPTGPGASTTPGGPDANQPGN